MASTNRSTCPSLITCSEVYTSDLLFNLIIRTGNMELVLCTSSNASHLPTSCLNLVSACDLILGTFFNLINAHHIQNIQGTYLSTPLSCPNLISTHHVHNARHLSTPFTLPHVPYPLHLGLPRTLMMLSSLSRQRCGSPWGRESR